jgi:DNA-binding NarL/FixJ family response regulator
MKVKVLIADDHTLFNEGIKQLLAETYDIVSQIYDGKEVLPAIHLHRPEVILLDINLPSINGFYIAKDIKKSFDLLKIVFLSMYSESDFIEQAKRIPVHGYMLKHSTKEELVESINAVMSGKIYYDPKLNQNSRNLHQDDFFVKQFALSGREVEIIKLIKEGLNSREIGQKLSLSEETIKTHRKNIHFKLGIKSMVELIEFAHKNGI